MIQLIGTLDCGLFCFLIGHSNIMTLLQLVSLGCRIFFHSISQAPLNGDKIGSVPSLLVSVAPLPSALSLSYFTVILPRGT